MLDTLGKTLYRKDIVVVLDNDILVKGVVDGFTTDKAKIVVQTSVTGVTGYKIIKAQSKHIVKLGA